MLLVNPIAIWLALSCRDAGEALRPHRLPPRFGILQIPQDWMRLLLYAEEHCDAVVLTALHDMLP